MDNKKEQTELTATNIISLFHKKKKKKKKKKTFFVKKAGRHFGFLKKAGRHQKGAGRRALQKRPRQNTVCSMVLCHEIRACDRLSVMESIPDTSNSLLG